MSTSNRYYNQFQYTLEKDTVTLYGTVAIGASGAVGTVTGAGIAGIVKVPATTGQYEIELSDKFSKLLFAHVGVVFGTLTTVAQIQIFEAGATYQADLRVNKKFIVACSDFAGAAVNPASGSVLNLCIVLRKSSVDPFA